MKTTSITLLSSSGTTQRCSTGSVRFQDLSHCTMGQKRDKESISGGILHRHGPPAGEGVFSNEGEVDQDRVDALGKPYTGPHKLLRQTYQRVQKIKTGSIGKSTLCTFNSQQISVLDVSELI